MVQGPACVFHEPVTTTASAEVANNETIIPSQQEGRMLLVLRRAWHANGNVIAPRRQMVGTGKV
jgi:hypothetical protein